MYDIQKEPLNLRSRRFNRGGNTRSEKRILVLQTGIAGLLKNIKSDDEKEAVKSIVPGMELLMYREPDNKYDKWAVAFYLNEEDKLGFISRFKNQTIARLMDAGKKFVAVVDEKKDLDYSIEKVRLDDGVSATEDMSVPVSIYLVE